MTYEADMTLLLHAASRGDKATYLSEMVSHLAFDEIW
jgi:hypothetical protein